MFTESWTPAKACDPNQPRGESAENPRLMRLLDEQYTRTPFYGRRRMRAWLQGQGYDVNPKRVARLMELIGIAAIYPKPKLSVPGEGHTIYPYLLEGVEVNRVNQVFLNEIEEILIAATDQLSTNRARVSAASR